MRSVGNFVSLFRHFPTLSFLPPCHQFFYPARYSWLAGCLSSRRKSKSFRLGRPSRTLVLLVPDGNSSASVSIHRPGIELECCSKKQAGGCRRLVLSIGISPSLLLFDTPLPSSWISSRPPSTVLSCSVDLLLLRRPVRLLSFVWSLAISDFRDCVSCIGVLVIHSKLPRVPLLLLWCSPRHPPSLLRLVSTPYQH